MKILIFALVFCNYGCHPFLCFTCENRVKASCITLIFYEEVKI